MVQNSKQRLFQFRRRRRKERRFGRTISHIQFTEGYDTQFKFNICKQCYRRHDE
jgi:hypothetical protein